jgi:formylglycine-generating enzyme required for sulfatase activity
VLGLAILFVSRWDERFAPEPTEMPTIAPSDTSTAPPTVIAPVPSPTDPPTAMPTEVTPTRTPTEPPSSAPVLTPGATQVRDADGMVMVYVPAGEFEMGSDDEDVDYAVQLCNEYRGNCERGWYEIEQPVHTVEIDAFWVDQTEVTNAQYALCVADGVCDESHLAGDADFNGDGYPVVGVSWHDANTYCEWTGARLPTEAEWEYAARGPESYIYPWRGDFHCSRGNFDDETQVTDYIVPGGEGCDGHEKTAPVGSYPAGASWCGALDMAGNVWEWVADWYDSEFYEHSPTRSPTGPSSGEYRGLRGGSWGNLQINARCASRLWYHPDYWSVNWGFRCAGGSE